MLLLKKSAPITRSSPSSLQIYVKFSLNVPKLMRLGAITTMGLSQEATKDLTWWIENTESKQTCNSLTHTKPDAILSHAASLTGGGAECN